jgi:lipoprotein NlpI
MCCIAILVSLPLVLATAVGAEPESPHEHVARGMELFRANDIDGSLRHFDKAAVLDPDIVPRLWQRGISHYYAGKYKDGVRQFEIHKTANPHDVENAAWHFLCAARVEGIDAAQKSIIPIDTKLDRRVPMEEIYELYAGRGSVDAVLAAAKQNGRPTASMYADLYLGLYYEVQDENEKAKRYLQQAASAKLRGSYMHDVAKVHVLQRRWDQEQPGGKSE